MTGIGSVDCTLANNPDVPIIDLTIVANNRAVILCTDSVNSQNKIECHSDPVRGKNYGVADYVGMLEIPGVRTMTCCICIKTMERAEREISYPMGIINQLPPA